MNFNPYYYLYYCYYKLFKAIKRNVDIDHDLASRFFGIVMSVYSLSIITILNFKLKPGLQVYIYVFGIMVIWHFVNKVIFLKTKRYKRIIEHYENDKKSNIFLARSIAVLFSIGAFGLFYLTVTGYFDK